MKTRINLYSEQFRPQLDLLSLNFVLCLVGVLLLTLIGLGSWQGQQANKQASNLANQQVQVQQQQQQITTISNALAARKPSVQLTANLAQLQQQLAAQKQLLAQLAGRQQHKTRGFAGLMATLAEASPKDLWLTDIQLQGNQLDLRGVTQDADALPRWVKQLGQSPYLKGTDFAGAHLYRDETQALRFILSSTTNAQDTSEVAANE